MPSSAFGYAQALDGTWSDYQRATGASLATRDRFEDAADFVGWYVAESRRRLKLAPEDYVAHYLAYHEGHGGYARATHRAKAWLLEVAARVGRTAQRYDGQIARCRARLNGGGWWLFG